MTIPGTPAANAAGGPGGRPRPSPTRGRPSAPSSCTAWTRAAALAGASAPQARQALIERLDELVRQAQADGAMRADAGTGDLMDVLSVFACHPGVMPERFLLLMLDGLERRN